MFDLQKASMLKHVSAWLLDVILLSVLATGFALLLSAAFGYDNYNDNLQRYYTEYEQLYGIDFNISDEEYLALGEEDRLRYADAYAKLNDDADVSRAFSIIIQLSLAIMSLSVFAPSMALHQFCYALFYVHQIHLLIILYISTEKKIVAKSIVFMSQMGYIDSTKAKEGVL